MQLSNNFASTVTPGTINVLTSRISSSPVLIVRRINTDVHSLHQSLPQPRLTNLL
jgi:hypothetical protein